MTRLLTCLLLLLVGGSVRAESLWLDQADGVRLYYYLDLPTAPPSVPLVVILQGSECLKVEHKYAPMIEQLNRRGVGVLRIEKPGLTPTTPIGDCPPEYLLKNTLDRRLWDVLRVVAELRGHPRWNGRLALVGGSEGGMLAGLLAPLIPEARAVVMLSSGGGMSFGEELQRMVAAHIASQGAAPEKVAEELRKLEEVLQRARREPSTTREWGSDGQLARNTHLWLSRALDLSIWRALLAFQGPILVVHGTADASTPVESARELARRFLEAGRSNLELRLDPGGQHGPRPEVIQESLEWVVERLR